MIEEPASYHPLPKDTSSETCLTLVGVKCSSENNQQEKYNNPVKYGIDEYFALKPNRF
jgi:hypothetical protein